MNETHPLQFGYILSADDIFKLVTETGLPLWSVIEESIKKNINFFPWYGYARRRWHSGTNKETILSEIKESMLLNPEWGDSEDFICGELSNLWEGTTTL